MTADKLVGRWVAIARNTGGYLNLTTKQVNYLAVLCREGTGTAVVETANRRRYHYVGTPYAATVNVRTNGTAILALDAA